MLKTIARKSGSCSATRDVMTAPSLCPISPSPMRVDLRLGPQVGEPRPGVGREAFVCRPLERALRLSDAPIIHAEHGDSASPQ